jgi:hypothetical protein
MVKRVLIDALEGMATPNTAKIRKMRLKEMPLVPISSLHGGVPCSHCPGFSGAIFFANGAAIVTEPFVRQNWTGPGREPDRVNCRLHARACRRRDLDSHLLAIGVPDQCTSGYHGHCLGLLRAARTRQSGRKQRFDWMGSFTFTVGLGSSLLSVSLIAFPLISINNVYALFVCAILALTAFFVVEKRVDQPMLDFKLFKDKLFAHAAAANA